MVTLYFIYNCHIDAGVAEMPCTVYLNADFSIEHILKV